MTVSFGRLGGDSGISSLEKSVDPVDSQQNLQSRFDEIKNKLGDGDKANDESAKKDLSNLQKEAEGYLQSEEAKPGGGDPKTLEKLEKLLEEMGNMQEVKPLQP